MALSPVQTYHGAYGGVVDLYELFTAGYGKPKTERWLLMQASEPSRVIENAHIAKLDPEVGEKIAREAEEYRKKFKAEQEKKGIEE